MTVSLGDALTTLKNIVSAINNAAQTYLTVQGKINSAAITASTSVSQTSGRVAVVSVTVAGSATGSIYDSATTATTRQIYSIPNTVGVYVINIPVSYGILVVPGTGQTVTVSYS